MKPHSTVNLATTFWMAQHPKQFHVRAMGRGLQQHLCAQVSPLVTKSYISEQWDVGCNNIYMRKLVH